MFLLTAVGIAVAGDNEAGWRIAHAFCGFLALILLWQLCRLSIPGASRLHFMLVALVALSPQMLMYFRASRYYAFSTLCFLATIYAYLKWWDSRKNAWLIALGAVLDDRVFEPLCHWRCCSTIIGRLPPILSP